MTLHLGFHIAGEGKVMGLAGDGSPAYVGEVAEQVKLGSYPADRMQSTLREAGLQVCRYDDPQERAAAVARRIADGKIVGHCWGSSEFGPRALGHRSIWLTLGGLACPII